MSIKIFTFILLFYFIEEFNCHVSANGEVDFKNSQFAKTLLTLANIFENKTDESYFEAEKLLNSEVIDIKSQCRMNRNLYYVDLQQKEYENMLQKVLKTNYKSLSSFNAKELWNSIEIFFQEISNCYPFNFPFGTLSIHKIAFNMMSIIANAIIDRFNFFITNGKQLKNTTSHECQLGQDKRKLLFFQELLMQMSPIIGSCNDSVLQRKCMLNKFQNVSQDLRNQLRTIMSPIGPENLCKDV
ncbi:uncharacterized protein LOC122501772 [Leptopilina heterotoma]|uniref:uncharacterized protein LOC122501772 n=1 Tax=Leptopilina heterotoma TaxID=63436 RepID=UPI001CA98C09|nr:uncharacterized protein LOC122501772 [Leptopilina heterotoma]